MPTVDQDAYALPPPKVDSDAPKDDDSTVTALESYRLEADNYRKSGPNPRDDKWKENLDLYWNRFDFSGKEEWQAKEVMPEVPSFVNRFAAALKEALLASPDGFYTVVDPSDEEGDVTKSIKEMTDIWLSQCGTDAMGTPLDFSTVFEDQMKLGALMNCASVVTWKTDTPDGRVSIETVDPRNVWLDHTKRNLYRVRRVEVDKHELGRMAQLKDSKGKHIFNIKDLDQLVGSITMEQEGEKERLTGSGTGLVTPGSRQPIVLDEYLATVLGPDGKVMHDKSLFVVANQRFLIRGPEKNPFWHGRDWLTYSPLVTVPMSVYGRSYMEDFGRLAVTFNELTNLILDAVFTSSMKAFAMVPGYLSNPEQADEGIWPNKVFKLEEGIKPDDFAKALDLGTLPAEAIKAWETIKSELTEASGYNEIGLGQFAPNARTSATEVTSTTKSSSAILRGVAQTVEGRWLDPSLDLVWKTGLQHCSPTDKILKGAVGEKMFQALIRRRRELVGRSLTFQARGISAIIQRSQTLKALIQILSIIGPNQLLLQEFLKAIDLGKFINYIFELSDVPLEKMQLSEREKLIRSVAQPMGALQNGAAGAPSSGGQAAGEMQSVAKSMGVQRRY